MDRITVLLSPLKIGWQKKIGRRRRRTRCRIVGGKHRKTRFIEDNFGRPDDSVGDPVVDEISARAGAVSNQYTLVGLVIKKTFLFNLICVIVDQATWDTKVRNIRLATKHTFIAGYATTEKPWGREHENVSSQVHRKQPEMRRESGRFMNCLGHFLHQMD